SREEIERFFEQGVTYTFDQLRAGFLEEYGRDIGAVRVSVGIVTNFADLHAFLEFLAGFLDKRVDELDVDTMQQLGDLSSRDSA
ncbi:MAG: hypothetical protein PVH60_08830, partial [Anaerolineales bacterium]